MKHLVFIVALFLSPVASAWTDYLPNYGDDNSQYINTPEFNSFYSSVFLNKYAVSPVCYIRGNAVSYNGTVFHVHSYQLAQWFDEVNLKMITVAAFYGTSVGTAMLKRTASLRTVDGNLLRDQFSECASQRPLYSADPNLSSLVSNREHHFMFMDFLFRMGQI